MGYHVTPFYWRWIWANGWSEAVGLGSTVLIAAYLAPRLDTLGAGILVLGALVAVMLGALLEGGLVGAAQEHVLQTRLPDLLRGRWTAATAIGAGIAWALGMLPSTILGVMESSQQPASAPVEPGLLTRLVLAIALGALTGPVLGAVQWSVLRRHVRHARRWLWANAAAWAIGMPLMFAGMDRVAWDGPALTKVAGIYVTCGVVGAAVGAVHGGVLVGLVREARAVQTRSMKTA
jgi:hypothetical protein